jgi:hypothetical protein
LQSIQPIHLEKLFLANTKLKNLPTREVVEFL